MSDSALLNLVMALKGGQVRVLDLTQTFHCTGSRD
jgi:hypothetical protein